MGKAKEETKVIRAQWCCHTPSLMSELINNSGDAAAIAMPLKLFYAILQGVAQRALELNDPKLNMLMARLTLYTCSDPDHEDYVPNWREIMWEAIDEMEKKDAETKKEKTTDTSNS